MKKVIDLLPFYICVALDRIIQIGIWRKGFLYDSRRIMEKIRFFRNL